MQKVTKFYVALVALSAVTAAAFMYAARPAYTAAEVQTLAFLSVIAVVSELLAFTLVRGARGSLAFIPYLASVIIVPSWLTIVAIVSVKLAIELLSSVDRIKAIFNSFSHGLTLAAAIAVYATLGGTSLLAHSSQTLSTATAELGLAAVLAYLAAFAVNACLFSIVIALESGDSFWPLLWQNVLSAIGGDVMATPVVFVFAWIYTTFGMMAAAVSWIPILGLRHVSRLNAELQRTNEELLQLMVKSIEARDPYTSGHSRRVSKYAVAIARLIGRSEKEIKDIETAALLHDVGKIYEKYGPILASSGRLTAAEWTTMQEHPIDGANLVDTISRMRHLVPAVRHHHENWDGTGYPDRISGEAIPLASRIIMFADTIDAMTSERPYRRPLGEADVCAELVRCRGKQFDPAISDRLLAAGVWKTLFGHERNQRPKLELLDTKTA